MLLYRADYISNIFVTPIERFYPRSWSNISRVYLIRYIDRFNMVYHGHSDGNTANVPLGNILGTSLRLILNFTDLEHCDHTAGDITKEIANEPLRNTTSTFFGKLQGEPTDYLIRTLWSHDLEHCECTEHFPSMSHLGTSWILSLGNFVVYPWIT